MSSNHQNGHATDNEALRASELSYRRLFEAAKDGILILDVDTGCINDVNRFLIKLLGFSRSEMIGKTVGELSPFKDIESNKIMLERLQKDGYVRYENLPLEAKDGRKIAVEFVSNVYQAGDKQVIQCNIRDITERKRIEKELQIADEKLCQLLAHSPAVLYTLKIDGQTITPVIVSDNIERLLGFTVEETCSREWWVQSLHPEDRDRALKIFTNSLSQIGYSMEYRILHKDGTYRWVEDNNRALRDADGKVNFMVGVWIDISERKQAEEVLHKVSRQEFGRKNTRVIWDLVAIFGLVILSICVLDYTDILLAPLEKLVLFYKGNLDDLFGPPIVLLLGLLIFSYRRWRDVQSQVGEQANIQEALRTMHGELEKRIQHRTAELTRANETLHTEITERKRAERRLATQSAISRVLADSNTLKEATPNILQAVCESEGWTFGAIWEVDKKSNVLRCIEAWHRPEFLAEELTAKTRGMTFVLNACLPGRVWASDKPLLIPDIANDPDYQRTSLATKIGLHSALAFPIALEGEVIGVMDFLGCKIYEADEKTLEMFLIIGRQVGSFFKRKQLEEQFRQSQKMEGIGQLAGGVAHDFNNILAIIQMQSDLLKSCGDLSVTQLEFADEIGVTVKRAAALTRQLLLFSSREVFQPCDLDLSASITNTTKMLMRILGENIQIQLKLAAQPMFIHADAGMMDQVLLNLAVNARDAMPNGGRLVIETSAVEFDEVIASQSTQMRPGLFVCLNVSDSGCGIPPEIIPKIFEPFFTTKDIGKGTGLGLATVFGIVQQHQGWINVYSEVGQGTTFRIYFPRLNKNANLKSATLPLMPMRGGNEAILLVEDDPALRVSVRKALAQLGYRILEAPTGVKAFEVWKENRDAIRLLLTDLILPDGMNGKDLAQRILQENPKLKVIYMSGYSAEVVGKDFPLIEHVNFLTKPFQALKLAETVRESLDAKI